MNNTFNIQRFSWLFIKHTKEHYQTYLMSIAVLLGLITIGLGLSAYLNNGIVGETVQTVYFYIFLLFPGTIFTSMVFTDLGNKTKAIPALTLPVSNFERFLVAWLYSFIIFQIVFIACFFTIDLIILQIGNQNHGINNKLLHLDSIESKVYFSFLAFGILHAINFFGAIFFKKLHFIKTAFTLLIFIIFLSLANKLLISMLFSTEAHATVPFGGVFITDHHNGYYVEPNGSYLIVAATIVLFIFLLWTAAYFKLNEKQV